MSYGLTHLPPVNIRQLIWSALVQIMACRLFDAKPLFKPMQVYCQWDHQEQTSVKFEAELYYFIWRKYIWKCRLPDCRPFLSRVRVKFGVSCWENNVSNVMVSHWCIRILFARQQTTRSAFCYAQVVDQTNTKQPWSIANHSPIFSRSYHATYCWEWK